MALRDTIISNLIYGYSWLIGAFLLYDTRLRSFPPKQNRNYDAARTNLLIEDNQRYHRVCW